MIASSSMTSSDFTHTPPLSARGPTQIADRQSLRMPSTWSMTVGDLGVRPRRFPICVFTTICARHNSPSRLLPRSVAFCSVAFSLLSLCRSVAPLLRCSVAPSLRRSFLIHSSLHNYSFFYFLFSILIYRLIAPSLFALSLRPSVAPSLFRSVAFRSVCRKGQG